MSPRIRENIHNYWKFISIIFVLIIIFTVFLYSTILNEKNEKSPRETILVPLYSGNVSQFWEILNLSITYKNVDFSVIINPDNGSGESFNYTYYEWVKRLESSGVTVFGYVYTGYGYRSMENIIMDVQNYTKWYGIHGIFFDEVSDNLSKVYFYSSLVNTCRSMGISITIGNPGDPVPYNYLYIFNTTIIYEDQGYPNISQLKEYSKNISLERIGVICYGVQYNSTEISEIYSLAGVCYFTDQNLPDPYQNLSSYLPENAKMLNENS